jgi:hypothetical protein
LRRWRCEGAGVARMSRLAKRAIIFIPSGWRFREVVALLIDQHSSRSLSSVDALARTTASGTVLDPPIRQGSAHRRRCHGNAASRPRPYDRRRCQPDPRLPARRQRPREARSHRSANSADAMAVTEKIQGRAVPALGRLRAEVHSGCPSRLVPTKYPKRRTHRISHLAGGRTGSVRGRRVGPPLVGQARFRGRHREWQSTSLRDFPLRANPHKPNPHSGRVSGRCRRHADDHGLRSASAWTEPPMERHGCPPCLRVVPDLVVDGSVTTDDVLDRSYEFEIVGANPIARGILEHPETRVLPQSRSTR